MKTKNISFFMQSLSAVFESFCDWELSYADIVEMDSRIEIDELSATIGITGDILGYVYMSMSSHVGKNITSKMLGGMEVLEINELVTSAIGELSNMVVGNTCAQISTEGYTIDITPPSITLGRDIKISTDAMIYRLPVIIKNIGSIQIDLALKTA